MFGIASSKWMLQLPSQSLTYPLSISTFPFYLANISAVKNVLSVYLNHINRSVLDCHLCCRHDVTTFCIMRIIMQTERDRRLIIVLRQEFWDGVSLFCVQNSSRPLSTTTVFVIAARPRCSNSDPLTFRHRASCILGQAFHYSPENAFYVFNQQIYFIIWYMLDRASFILIIWTTN